MEQTLTKEHLEHSNPLSEPAAPSVRPAQETQPSPSWQKMFVEQLGHRLDAVLPSRTPVERAHVKKERYRLERTERFGLISLKDYIKLTRDGRETALLVEGFARCRLAQLGDGVERSPTERREKRKNKRMVSVFKQESDEQSPHARHLQIEQEYRQGQFFVSKSGYIPEVAACRVIQAYTSMQKAFTPVQQEEQKTLQTAKPAFPSSAKLPTAMAMSFTGSA